MNWSADHRPCWFLFLSLVCVVCFLVFLSVLFVFGFLVFAFVLHGDSSMDYVSIQFSSLLYHIVIMTNVATALIRGMCTMQLSFRLEKRPGESHLALDGKKRMLFRWHCVLTSVFAGICVFDETRVFSSFRDLADLTTVCLERFWKHFNICGNVRNMWKVFQTLLDRLEMIWHHEVVRQIMP